MMLIVTRSAFVVYLKQANSVAIEDLFFSLLFFSFSISVNDKSHGIADEEENRNCWKKKTMTTRNIVQHRFSIRTCWQRQKNKFS